MAKVQGLIQDYALVRETYSQTIISYGLVPMADGIHATWQEVYFQKSEVSKPTIEQVRDAVISDINARVKENIISGYVWNGKPVWLSEENQMNFAQGVAPVTLKIGEDAEKSPIYQDFETAEELKSFSDACTLWKQQCLHAGYGEKDGIDWEPYRELLEEN